MFFKVPLSNYRHNLFFIDTESLGELSFHLYSEMLAIPFYAKELSERIENVYETQTPNDLTSLLLISSSSQ